MGSHLQFLPRPLRALIFGALGLMHPLFPYMATQDAPREYSTGALAVVSSGFRMGTFVSPFFFRFVNPLAGVDTIRSEFMLAAVLFAVGALVSTVVLFKPKN